MSDSEGGIPLVEPLSSSPEPSKKRKRDDEPESKRMKNKRKRTKKPKDIDEGDLDEEAGVNHAIAHMDPSLLADYVAQRTKRFQSDLSMVELEDRYIPEKAIRDTTNWNNPRSLDCLPAFLEEIAGDSSLTKAPNQKGTPHTLVIASAGLRSADLARALRTFQTKDSSVAKLFAKHIKMKQAIETCKKSRMGIGVGTPQRVSALLDDGALSATHLERIVVDASHIDQKKRGVLDMKDTLVPLVDLLGREEFKERYGKGLQVVFF